MITRKRAPSLHRMVFMNHEDIIKRNEQLLIDSRDIASVELGHDTFETICKTGDEDLIKKVKSNALPTYWGLCVGELEIA